MNANKKPWLLFSTMRKNTSNIITSCTWLTSYTWLFLHSINIAYSRNSSATTKRGEREEKEKCARINFCGNNFLFKRNNYLAWVQTMPHLIGFVAPPEHRRSPSLKRFFCCSSWSIYGTMLQRTGLHLRQYCILECSWCLDAFELSRSYTCFFGEVLTLCIGTFFSGFVPAAIISTSWRSTPLRYSRNSSAVSITSSKDSMKLQTWNLIGLPGSFSSKTWCPLLLAIWLAVLQSPARRSRDMKGCCFWMEGLVYTVGDVVCSFRKAILCYCYLYH